MITNTHPELKYKKLPVFLLVNSCVSILAYVSGMVYRFSKAAFFEGENALLLQILKYVSAVSFFASVIFFFFIFIEFYSFILELRRLHIEFSVRYLNKYLTSAEKNYGENKTKIIRTASAAFCVKILSAILPESGLVIFAHSMIIAAFVFFAAKGLYQIKESIYSCYIEKEQSERG